MSAAPDNAAPQAPASHPIVLFDGVCNLCNASVRFIIARDPAARLRFASMQSPLGQSLLIQYLGAPQPPESMVVLDGARVLTRSDAALAIAERLTAPWRWAGVFRVIPRPVRDTLYTFIARRRYRFFGKRDVCWVPTPALASRFLS